MDIAGLLILIMPRLLNLVVAIFLILNGLERDAALVPGQRYKVVAR